MIVHNLLLKLKDGSAETIARTQKLLLGMQGKIEGMRELKVVVDIRRAESSYDLALIAKFDSLEELQAYLPHPVHVEASGQIVDNIAAAANVWYEE
jgi:hypothetical protein